MLTHSIMKFSIYFLQPRAGVVLVVLEGAHVLVALGPPARHVPLLRAHSPATAAAGGECPGTAPPQTCHLPLAETTVSYARLTATIRRPLTASRPPALMRSPGGQSRVAGCATIGARRQLVTARLRPAPPCCPFCRRGSRRRVKCSRSVG